VNLFNFLRRIISYMSIEVGSKLDGKVTGITHFGAFIELPDGVTGLVHISEIADNYVKDVNEFLKLNDVVKVKVINVEKDGKIGLSIKQAQDRPVEEAKPAYNRPDRGSRPEGGGGRPPFRSEGGGRPPFRSEGGGGGRPPFRQDQGGRPNRGGKSAPPRPANFEDKMSKFLKDSEDRLTSLKRNTESKRGGRGARKG
jgi:S1 RNA binding domain protein